MIHWLTSAGVPAAVVKWAIVGMLGWLVKLVRAHIHLQRRISDQLDTSTPGGLTDVVTALERKPAPRRPAAKAKPRSAGEGRG